MFDVVFFSLLYLFFFLSTLGCSCTWLMDGFAMKNWWNCPNHYCPFRKSREAGLVYHLLIFITRCFSYWYLMGVTLLLVYILPSEEKQHIHERHSKTNWSPDTFRSNWIKLVSGKNWGATGPIKMHTFYYPSSCSAISMLFRSCDIFRKHQLPWPRDFCRGTILPTERFQGPDKLLESGTSWATQVGTYTPDLG